MRADTSTILKQFEPIEQLYSELISGQGGYPPEKVERFYTACIACIDRIAGQKSPYAQRVQAEFDMGYVSVGGKPTLPGHVRPLYGIVQALKSDVAAGYLTSLRELVHADLFSDFIEGADHLLHEGYKDAAAVVVGGVLEEHIRQLCRKHGIATEFSNAAGELKPKKADAMNAELAKAGVYGKLEQKQVVAWLDLRNNAAHGHYTAYQQSQVELFLHGVRGFILSYPA